MDNNNDNNTTNNTTNNNIKNDKNDKQLCIDKCYQLHPQCISILCVIIMRI